jgi:16S rRNA processing protein RimM
MILVTADRVALGQIGKAHGITGAFRVRPYADDLERFAGLKAVTISRGPKSVSAAVQWVRLAPGHVVMQTDALHSPEDVQVWLGGDIEIDANERVELPEGQFFHDQIIGLAVETVEGKKVGTVVRIIDGPANDVYVCQDGDAEYMIPAVDVFIKLIDIRGGRMIIDPIPGMLD